LAGLQEAGVAIEVLADLSLPVLENHAHVLSPLVFRRLRHVVTENARVVETVAALAAGRLETLASLFAQSQASLRDDYEVSCKELDLLCEIAGRHEGVLGARMTGGGFGGSVVVLTRNPEGLGESIGNLYGQAAGVRASVLEVVAATGASRLTPATII
jgi:galactokinase